MIADAHCHFFSAGFFRTVGREAQIAGEAAEALPARFGWEPPGTNEALADRWVSALDEHEVSCAMIIASVPGDEDAVAAAVRRHPARLVGGFMINPLAGNLEARISRGFGALGLTTACLFPAMHHVRPDHERARLIFASAAAQGRAVFVHCGFLSVGIRSKLGLLSPFDLRCGDPLAVAAIANLYPSVPVIIPHFGAGLFRETLMAAASAPNILLDTSSSNNWIRFHPGLTLREVFARTLDVVGPTRLLFGTDSSFFPRGWQQPIYEQQRAILVDLGVSADDQEKIFRENFERTLSRKP